jgi:hypothetical protein
MRVALAIDVIRNDAKPEINEKANNTPGNAVRRMRSSVSPPPVRYAMATNMGTPRTMRYKTMLAVPTETALLKIGPIPHAVTATTAAIT